ncbi:MAG: APC family permease [Acidobacteriota bacterium]
MAREPANQHRQGMPQMTKGSIRSHPSLVRALGRWDLTAVGVNQVIGSGIFVLPMTVAALVGAPASPLVFIAAGIANALIVLCFAEAGSRFRGAGGPYLYASAAFGPLAGFEVAWMMWLTRVASQAALANALAVYLGFFWQGATQGLGRISVILAALLLLATINLLGVRYGSWTVNLFTVGKLVPLVIFVVLGVAFVDWGRFGGLSGQQLAGFGRGVLLLMFAFGGYELITIPASEARSPRRDAPRALLMTIGVVCAIYLLVQVVTVGTLADLESSETPLADAAGSFLGPLAGILIAVGGLISIGGSNAGTMLAGPRITYALAEKKQLPAIFAHVHRRYRTPDFSILVYLGVSVTLALSGTFERLAAVSAVARIVFYIATCAAVPVLRRRTKAREGAFELPWGLTIPALALIVCFAILAGAQLPELYAGLAALAIGALLYGTQLLRRGRAAATR